MERKISVLHFADLHLGNDFSVLGGRQARTRKEDLNNTFSKIINLCKSEKIQLLLIAGDLFESWDIDEETFLNAKDAFASILDTKIVISAGNHDPLSHNSPYKRKAFWSENVFVLSPEFDSVLFDDIGTEVWGTSFTSPYANQSLFGNVKPKNNNYIQIGVIHGSLGSKGQVSPYNPISTDQIKNSGLDYLALGHIHKNSGILFSGKTHYAYSGCPEGRGFDELDEKGVLIGEVYKNQKANIAFYKTSQRMYIEKSVDILGCDSSRAIANEILNVLETSYEDFQDHLYKIILKGEMDERSLISLESIKGALDQLFYVKLRDKSIIKINLEEAAKESSLRGFFIQHLLKEKTSSSESDELIQNTLTIGLKSFSGEVEFYED